MLGRFRILEIWIPSIHCTSYLYVLAYHCQTNSILLPGMNAGPTCEFCTFYTISNPQSQSITIDFFPFAHLLVTLSLCLHPESSLKSDICNLYLWIFLECNYINIFLRNPLWHMCFSTLILISQCLLCKYTDKVTIFLIIKNNWYYYLPIINL